MKRDRERQAHQDKKAIEFLEGDKKRSRGEVQETRELLEQKEIEIRNKAKELESRVIELKSLEARFAKIQTACHSNEEQLVKEKGRCQRALNLLSEANKAIKHKEVQLRQMETRLKELEKYVKQIKGIGAEREPPISAKTTPEAEKPSTKIEEEDLASCLDGEIMGDEEPEDIIKLNKLQQELEQSQHEPEESTDPNPEVVAASKPLSKREMEGVPEQLLCVACLEAPRSTVIVTCKHSVYCIKCDNAYNLKHALKKECPICRKEYKKTMPIFFG